MTFLPVVDRELRVRARLRSTYRLRFIAALVSIALSAVLLSLVGATPGGSQAGEVIFVMLGALAYASALFDGVRSTADCLSEEKRSGTLGLLFLTDLRPYDVVLGKLMASSLNSFYGLLAVFPALAVPLVVGGVTVGELWRLVLALLNTMFLSVCVGLIVSSLCRDERRAWISASAALLFLAVAPPLLLNVPWLASTPLATTSPTTAFVHLFDADYMAASERYWNSIGFVHLLGWLCLFAAMFILPRTWQDRGEVRAATATEGQGRFSLSIGRQSMPDDFAGRAAMLDGNPAVWLVARAGLRWTLVWMLLAAAGIVLGLVWQLSAGAMTGWWAIGGVMLLLHVGLAVNVAVEACHLFSGARDSGAMELLLCTPLSAKDVVEGHIEGLRRLFLRPGLVLIGIDVVLLAGFMYLGIGNGVSTGVGLLIAFAVLVCLLGTMMDLVAVARYGLWQGLVQRRPVQAVTRTILWVLVLPLLLCICGGGFMLPIVWPLKNLVFMSYAREQLRRQFRGALTERYGWAEESELVSISNETQR